MADNVSTLVAAYGISNLVHTCISLHANQFSFLCASITPHPFLLTWSRKSKPPGPVSIRAITIQLSPKQQQEQKRLQHVVNHPPLVTLHVPLSIPRMALVLVGYDEKCLLDLLEWFAYVVSKS